MVLTKPVCLILSVRKCYTVMGSPVQMELPHAIYVRDCRDLEPVCNTIANYIDGGADVSLSVSPYVNCTEAETVAAWRIVGLFYMLDVFSPPEIGFDFQKNAWF